MRCSPEIALSTKIKAGAGLVLAMGAASLVSGTNAEYEHETPAAEAEATPTTYFMDSEVGCETLQQFVAEHCLTYELLANTNELATQQQFGFGFAAPEAQQNQEAEESEVEAKLAASKLAAQKNAQPKLVIPPPFFIASPPAEEPKPPPPPSQPPAEPLSPPEAAGDNSPASNQQLGMSMAAEHGYDPANVQCLVELWDYESGWEETAQNDGSGAYGIPQALPGGKMASAGADWQTNPATQISWGLSYVDGRYGSACNALNHFHSRGWY